MLNCGTVRVHDAEFRRVCPPCNGLVGFSGDGIVAAYDAAHDFGYFDGLRLERSVGGFELNEERMLDIIRRKLGACISISSRSSAISWLLAWLLAWPVGAVIGGAEVGAKLALFAQDASERSAEVVVEQLEILLRYAAPVPHVALRCAVAPQE